MLIKPPLSTPSSALAGRDMHDPMQEIVAYLRQHPGAADSVDGIVDWWLPLQRYETAREAIQLALDDLVEQGVVDEIIHGSTTLYRLSRDNPVAE